jgi:hypothetical protein
VKGASENWIQGFELCATRSSGVWSHRSDGPWRLTSKVRLRDPVDPVAPRTACWRGGETQAADIDWRSGEVVVRGEGNREDRLPLPVDVGEAVVGWLRRGRPRCADQSVFTRDKLE